MASTGRRMVVAVPALVVLAAAWLRLEQPVAPLWRVVALLGLALGAAAVPGARWRAAAVLVAAVLGLRVVAGVWLVPSRPLNPASAFGLGGPLSDLATRFGNGFTDFYGTHLPFDPRVHAGMGELVLVALFCFALLVALPATARKPVPAVLALLVGAGWPATLLGSSGGVAMGAAILAAALLLLAGLGRRRLPALALPAVALVAAGAVAVGSAAAARHGLVHWQSWNPTGAATGPVGVGFVWNAQYDGLDWPAKATVALRVQAPRRPVYLRAGVLDDFTGDVWKSGEPRPADALEPAAALQPQAETREVVTIEGLRDPHLVGGSVPVRFAADGVELFQPQRGFAALSEDLPAGFRYTAWSYAARPSPAALLRSPADYPAVLARDGLLDVGQGVSTPPFGAPGRARTLETLLTRTPALGWYVPLARLAAEVAGNARTPYAAVARLEHWFLVSGGFRYSNHPPVIQPALAGFVTQTRSGYCQFFAGAMALMLRYLGIPARVAVGFAGGTYDADRHSLVVTDHDAHAWVEAWFKGYGWLPIDPTPPVPGSTRAPLVGGIASAGGGSGAGAGSPAGPGGAHGRNAPRSGHHFRSPDEGLGASSVTEAGAAGRGRGILPLLLLLGVAASLGAIVLTKLGTRAAARAARDPRRVAAACRRELAAFLADQRIEVGGSATLHELGELVQREFGAEPAAFVAAATAARFGRAELADVAARDARLELRALLGSMRRALTRRERLRGLLSLRSLGRPSDAVPRSASLGSGMAGTAGS